MAKVYDYDDIIKMDAILKHLLDDDDPMDWSTDGPDGPE